MMNHTFIAAQEESVLEWRVLYARNVLKLEMLAVVFERLGWCDTHGGEQGADGKYYVFNRVHDTHAYARAASADDEVVGFFGARGGKDPDAMKAYASALGVRPKTLDRAASNVQKIYRTRIERRFGKWTSQASHEAASQMGTQDALQA